MVPRSLLDSYQPLASWAALSTTHPSQLWPHSLSSGLPPGQLILQALPALTVSYGGLSYPLAPPGTCPQDRPVEFPFELTYLTIEANSWKPKGKSCDPTSQNYLPCLQSNMWIFSHLLTHLWHFSVDREVILIVRDCYYSFFNGEIMPPWDGVRLRPWSCSTVHLQNWWQNSDFSFCHCREVIRVVCWSRARAREVTTTEDHWSFIHRGYKLL